MKDDYLALDSSMALWKTMMYMWLSLSLMTNSVGMSRKHSRKSSLMQRNCNSEAFDIVDYVMNKDMTDTKNTVSSLWMDIVEDSNDLLVRIVEVLLDNYTFVVVVVVAYDMHQDIAEMNWVSKVFVSL